MSTGTAYAALVRVDFTARDTVVVIGQGLVSQSATQLARAMGAHVIGIDVSSDRVARAIETSGTAAGRLTAVRACGRAHHEARSSWSARAAT